ncbi:MAG TPA: LamG-like jellyroll fold domain-containing protein [Flavobacterium sp.]|jgi:hypothetical protein
MKTTKILISAIALSVACASLTSCGDDEGGSTPLPPIGGFNSADEVGAADLLAYWPLNGDGVETKSNTAPSNTVAATWVTGIKGQAVKFNSGFLDYPVISAISSNTSGSYTVSTWAKISNTKVTPDAVSTISPIITFTGGPDVNTGNLSLFGNTHGLISSDSIQMKAQFRFKKADGTDFGGDAINMIKMEPWMISDNAAGQNHTAAANKIGGQWAHIVYVYDGTTANNRIYVNGIKISNSQWESRNNGDALPMTFFTPSHPVIGATASVANGTNVEPWNAALKGEVDEVRVWKKVLSAGDINALYELEKVGR